MERNLCPKVAATEEETVSIREMVGLADFMI
jgi:hypothetical protein